MNNGTRKKVITSFPLNAYNSIDKQWKGIDSTLKKIPRGYKSEFGKYQVTLSSNRKVSITDGISAISWKYIDKQDETSEIMSKLRPIERISKPNKYFTEGRALYENVEDNVDLDYCITGNGVKENIVLNGTSDEYTYRFALNTKEYEVQLSEESGDIAVFRPTEEIPEFTMPKPFMYDALGVRNEAVSYRLEKVKKNNYMD